MAVVRIQSSNELVDRHSYREGSGGERDAGGVAAAGVHPADGGRGSGVAPAARHQAGRARLQGVGPRPRPGETPDLDQNQHVGRTGRLPAQTQPNWAGVGQPGYQVMIHAVSAALNTELHTIQVLAGRGWAGTPHS